MTVAGTVLLTAPAASAADSSSCNSGMYHFSGYIDGSSVNLHSGPGTSYSSKGLLSNRTKAHLYCYRSYGANQRSWDYIKITSGPHNGVKGWIRGDFYNIS